MYAGRFDLDAYCDKQADWLKKDIESDGFKTLTRDGITVTTSQVGTVNSQLEVGDVGITVEVTADAEMVSSNSATIVRTLAQKELET